MADRRATTSAENGKKGGRPVSEATKRAQAARDYISGEVEKSLQPIVAKAINDALLGDKEARKWLSEYAWGKPQQFIDLTSLGERLGDASAADLDDNTLRGIAAGGEPGAGEEGTS